VQFSFDFRIERYEFALQITGPIKTRVISTKMASTEIGMAYVRDGKDCNIDEEPMLGIPHQISNLRAGILQAL